MQYSLYVHLALALAIFLLAKISVLPDIVKIFFLWYWLDMDSQANSLLAVMRTRTLPEPQILDLYSKLKGDIKHRAVPENAISPVFELIRLALDAPNYLDAGLSMLSHLIKRLQGQHQDSLLDSQAQRLIPILVDRLASAKEGHRSRTRQALVALCGVSGTVFMMIVNLLADVTFRSDNPRAKEEAMQWILSVSYQAQFKLPS